MFLKSGSIPLAFALGTSAANISYTSTPNYIDAAPFIARTTYRDTGFSADMSKQMASHSSTVAELRRPEAFLKNRPAG